MDPLRFFLRNFVPGEESPATATGRILTEEEQVLRRVESLLGSFTRWNFEKVKDRLIEAITRAPSAFVLEGLVSTIFKLAKENDAYILVGRLCYELDDKLPQIPSYEPGTRKITFKRLLLNKCQMEFETAVADSQFMVYGEEQLKIRLLATLKLLPELYKHKMIPEMIFHHIIQMLLKPGCRPNLYIEAACQLLSSIGKQIDTRPRNRRILDLYSEKLNDLAAKPHLEPQIRDMVYDLLDLRANNWVKTTENTQNREEEFDIAAASTSNGTFYIAADGEQEPKSNAPSSSEEDTYFLASEPEDAEDSIYEQFEKAIALINVLKDEVNEERTKRIEAEKKAAQATRKVEELESRYKEAEDALVEEEEEVKRLKQLLQVYVEERHDLQVERDDALILTQDLLKNLAENTSIERQPLSSFICPISQEVMNDPQVAADGFSYNADDLKEWLNSGHETSPMTNLKLPHCNLVPNHTLRSAIQEWLQQNR